MATKATLTVAETLPKSFVLSCKTRGDKPAMREKLYGIWNAISWNVFSISIGALHGTFPCCVHGHAPLPPVPPHEIGRAHV